MRVIVNCAMTADGKLATIDRKQMTISSNSDMRRVHELRNSVDAILVGVGTVLADDPKLTVKAEYVPNMRNPMRVVLDSQGRTPPTAKVLSDAAPTIVYTTCETEIPGATVVALGDGGRVSVQKVVEDLEQRDVDTLLVEGGGEIIWSFFKAGLVDEYHVFIGAQIVGGRSAPTPVDGEGRTLDNGAIQLQLMATELLGDGILLSYRVSK